MSRAPRRLSGLFRTGVLALAGLVAFNPASVRAETSYHKLKKHLRQAERVSGNVAELVGVGAGAGACAVLLGICEGLADDSETASTQPNKAAPAAPAAPSRGVSNTRPPEPERERRK